MTRREHAVACTHERTSEVGYGLRIECTSTRIATDHAETGWERYDCILSRAIEVVCLHGCDGNGRESAICPLEIECWDPICESQSLIHLRCRPKFNPQFELSLTKGAVVQLDACEMSGVYSEPKLLPPRMACTCPPTLPGSTIGSRRVSMSRLEWSRIICARHTAAASAAMAGTLSENMFTGSVNEIKECGVSRLARQ